MIQIISKHSPKTKLKQSNLQITINPKHIFDLQFVLHTRLFFFKNSGGQFHIDFNAQKVLSGTIYIVPPLHFHHFSKNTFHDFICVDIDNDLLKCYHKQLLYFIKYNRQKSLSIQDLVGEKDIYETLLQLVNNAEFKEENFISTLVGWIENSIPKSVVEKTKKRNNGYISEADNFLAVLSQKELTVETCRVNLLALEMFCSERNLHRICTNTFGLGAKNIVKYHLAVKAIYLLSESQYSISDIAFELNFSTLTVFTRYMRRLTGYTPTDIRVTLRESML